jgi:hypothetical protein
MNAFLWKTSERDPSVRFREDAFSIQLSITSNDDLFLRFDKDANDGETWISDITYQEGDREQMINVIAVGAADFGQTIANRTVRILGIAKTLDAHHEVVAAYDRKRDELEIIASALNLRIKNSHLDNSRVGRFDLVAELH